MVPQTQRTIALHATALAIIPNKWFYSLFDNSYEKIMIFYEAKVNSGARI